MEYRFSEAKNQNLAATRGVSFDDVIEAIDEHGILMQYENPNQEKYPGQRVMVVRAEAAALLKERGHDVSKLILRR